MRFKRLYRYERTYREQNLSHKQRYDARLKEVKTYLEKVKKWYKKKQPKVLKTSPIGNVINYFLTEYAELSVFFSDDRNI